jgi:GAF domain-containing protein
MDELTLPAILQEVLDAIMELQGAEFGDVQLYDKATGTLKIVAHHGVDQEFLDHFETVDAFCCEELFFEMTRIVDSLAANPDFQL